MSARRTGRPPQVVKVVVKRPRTRRFEIVGPDGEILETVETKIAAEVAIDRLRDQLAPGQVLDVEWQ